MSWFVALRPVQDVALIERAAALHGPSSFSVTCGSWYLACGGLPATVSGRQTEHQVRIRCGVDLRQSENSFRIDAPPSFESLGSPATGMLDVQLEADCLTVRSDPSGLRTAYVGRIGDAIFVSTRLDWIAQLAGDAEIDFDAFGSHWLCHNQLSWRCFVKGFERLPPGGTATVRGQTVDLYHSPWTPDPAFRPADFESALRSALTPALPEGYRLSLGVSGGLDSRVLACIASDLDVDFHVLGEAAHPDVLVAQRLARSIDHPIDHIETDLPDASSALLLARRHSVTTCALAPASAAIAMGHFAQLESRRRILVDGGFGEIGRRQFMNRLLASGRSFADRSLLEMAGALTYIRANVFTSQVTEIMRAGMLRDIEEAFTNRPPLDGWTDADQADLVAVRYRLPNFFGFEQGRLDGHVAGYMPFATPVFLQTVFGTPMRERGAGRTFRRMIRDLAPSASRIPLVKGTVTYPFSLPPLIAFAYTTVKGRLQRNAATASHRSAFLHGVGEYVRDTAASSSVRDCGFYDIERLRKITDAHYSNEGDHSSEIDWWLSFELWRQSLAGK